MYPHPWLWVGVMLLLPYDGRGPLVRSPLPCLPRLTLQTTQKLSPMQEGCLPFLLQPALFCFMLQGYLAPVAASKEVV